MKTIINPFVSQNITKGTSAVFLANSKEEIINIIQELHEIKCEDCHIFDFGYTNDKKKRILPGDGYSLWWSSESMDEDEDDDINEYMNEENDEAYDFPDAKRLYVNPTIEMRQFGDEYLFYIELYDDHVEEVSLENVYMAYKLIYDKIPMMMSKDPRSLTFPSKKKDNKNNVH